LCLVVEVMLERSVWEGWAVPSRARPWIAVEAAQRRGSIAGAGGARTSRSGVKISVHVSTKAEGSLPWSSDRVGRQMEGGKPGNKRLAYTRRSDQSFLCQGPKNRRSIYGGAANQDHAGVTAFAHWQANREFLRGEGPPLSGCGGL
jgi:hypothetical protein